MTNCHLTLWQLARRYRHSDKESESCNTCNYFINSCCIKHELLKTDIEMVCSDWINNDD